MRITLFVKDLFVLSQTFIIHHARILAERGEQVTIVVFRRPKNIIHEELLKDTPNLRILYMPNEKGPLFRKVFGWIIRLTKAFVRSPRDMYKMWIMTGKYGSLKMRWYYMRKLKLLSLVGLKSDVYHFEFAWEAVKYLDYIKEFAKPCIVSFRGSDILMYPYWNKELVPLYRKVIQHVERVHCTSEAVAKGVAKIGDRRKIFVNYPSIDTSFFKPNSITKREANLVVTVARLKWEKGLIYALFAIAELISDFPDLRYVIMGDGQDRQQLLYYISDLGIRKHVELTGRVSAADVKNMLEKASIFLLSSLSEGLSNAALEAMAMEVPVVTTAAGGMPEAIDNGIEGFVVPLYDSSALAAKVRVLLENKDLCSQMGKNARQRILNGFSFEHQCEVYMKEYTALGKTTR